MITIKFIAAGPQPARAAAEISCKTGQTLMQAAVSANVAGIEADCGGLLTCGTCHVYVGEAWLSKLPAKGEDEQMMLDALGDLVPLKPGSRLSCQIPGGPELEGLELEIAPAP